MADIDQALSTPESSALGSTFVGRQGVRAGGRLLTFLTLTVVMLAASAPLVRLLKRSLSQIVSPWDVGDLIVRPAIVLLAVWLMGRWEHRSLDEYGLPTRLLLGKQFWTGALWALVMLSLIVARMTTVHDYSPGTLALSPLQIVKYGFVWGLALLIEGYVLGLFFGYIHFTLTIAVGFWRAVALTICIICVPFAMKTGEHRWIVGGVLTLFFQYLALRRTGNLWFGIGWLAACYWGWNFFYSMPSPQGMYFYGHLLNASIINRKPYGLLEIGMAISIFLLAKIYPEAKYPLSTSSAALEPISDEALPARPHSNWKRLFVGPHGLRAGWRLLIYSVVLLLIFCLPTSLDALAHLLGVRPPLQHLNAWENAMESSGVMTPALQLFQGGEMFVMLLLAAAVMGRFEHRSFANYGLPFRFLFRKQFWMGALFGLGILSLAICIMAAGHAYTPGKLVLSPLQIVKYGLLWAIASLIWACFNEFRFSGYIQFTLTTGLGFWPAATIICILCVVMQWQDNWIVRVETLADAFFLCVALRRTGNLWFGIGYGSAVGWGTNFLFSVPHHGIHAYGHLLDGSMRGWNWLSIFTIFLIVAASVLLAMIYPEAKYPAPVPDPGGGSTESDQSGSPLAATFP